jgi:hypothetical protein
MISRSQMNRQLYEMGGIGSLQNKPAPESEQSQITRAYVDLLKMGLSEDEARQSIQTKLAELSELNNRDNLLRPGEYAGENYKGSPDMYPDYEIDYQENNRQMRQMGGMGMQQAPQEMQPMQSQMQQMDAEQYRPVAEQLSQDPNQALMAIVRMLMEQGIPEEEAIKIAQQMIQAVAEGGMEELSDDTRIEARFGGRIGYAEGGISRLVNREQYGFGSIGKVFKGAAKAVTGAVKGVTSAVKSVAKSPIGRIALTIGAMYALGPAGLDVGAGMSPFAAGALKAGMANLAVQAVSGQGINFKEGLLAAGLGGVTGSLTAGQTGVTGTESMGAGGVQLNPLYNDLQYTPMDSFTSMGAGGVDMNAVYNDMGYTPSNITPSGVNMSAVYEDLTPVKTSSGIMDTLKSSGTKIFDVAKDYGTQALDFAKNNKLLTAGTIAAGASLLSPEMPEQLPGESMEEYNARVAEFERQYASNLSGRTGPSLPAGARNPFYPTYAANGGRVGYLFGGSGVATFQPNEGSLPSSGSGISNALGLGKLLRENPNIFNSLRSESLQSNVPQSTGPIPLGLIDYSGTPYENAFKKTSVAQPTVGGSTYSSGGGLGGLGVGSNLIKQITQQNFFNTDEEEEDTRYKLPASARNPFYGVMMANGGRMGYAMGNSVQEGIMAAPQIARQIGMPVGSPRMNKGGVPELDYRDEGGFVPPIGIKERADDIPAMLSNNEFVFTANAVKNAGGGDPNVGAQKMYTLMKRLESGGRV